MTRLAVLLLACGIAFAQKADVILEIEMPEGVRPPKSAPERVSKLLINGKDYTTPRLAKRTIAVPLGKDGKVMVEYTYWPTMYQRVIRSKTLAPKKGDEVKVDLTKADKTDKIWAIYVPTPMPVVKAMCKLAEVKKGDVVYDIGCGDGRLVIMAVKDFGAKRGVGIDILPERITECKANAKKAGVEKQVEFIQKDALTITDFSDADVVLLYLGERLNERLRPVLQKTLRPGARIVSHRFPLGKWEPEKTEVVEEKDLLGIDTVFLLHRWTIKKKGEKGKE
jgi:predicted RNA methylase